MIRIILLFALLVVPFFSASSNEKSLANSIDNIFSELNLEAEPACAVGLIKNNEYLYKRGYGLSNLEHKIALTPDSVFRIGSISKQFTAMAILILEEKGALSLDDPIRKYIPDLIDYKENVTIRHLIHHYSGLGDYEYSDYPGRFINSVGEEFRWGNQDYMSNDEVYSLFKTLPLIMKPETKFWYSNLGYGLLTIVIENITGMTLREFAEKEIFKPLGMDNTFFNDDVNLVITNRADAYTPRENYLGEYKIFMTNLSNVGDGGVYTTINDFIKWDQNFYGNNLGDQNDELIQRMKHNFFKQSAEISRKDNDVYRDEDTYAFAQNFDVYRGSNRWSHSGSWVGYTAKYSRFEDLEFSTVVFCNNEAIDAGEVSDKIIEMYFNLEQK